MGFKSGLAGLVVGFIAGFIAYPVNELYGLALAIIAAGLVSRGVFSGAFSSAILGVLVPMSNYLLALYIAIENKEIELMYALVLVVTRIINVFNIQLLIGAAIGGAIFGYIGKKTLSSPEE